MRIIRGKYGRRHFSPPHNIKARPTTDFAKENIFNVIENIIDIEGITALDLFAGTGAISWELISRGARSVTAVEKALPQVNFILKTANQLGDKSLHLIKGDVFKFITTSTTAYDFIFADPPYDLPNFGDIPKLILESHLIKPGTLFVMEHSKKYDFSDLFGFIQHREYGSVNFSLFLIPEL